MDFSLELEHGMASGKWIVGIDEVGRGPIAGPVFAAAVVFPPRLVLRSPPAFLAEVRDSKKLNEPQRNHLACAIGEHAFCALGAASVAEISRLNILQASLIAMQRACARLELQFEQGQMPHAYLVDGIHKPNLNSANLNNLDLKARTPKIQTVVQGDDKSITIACAAIIAKVARDRLMCKLHAQYPPYGWNSNKGYPVPEHLKALQQDGLSAHHRTTFAPCAKMLVKDAR